MQAGNFGGDGEFLLAAQLGDPGREACARLQGRSMAVLFVQGGQLFKFEAGPRRWHMHALRGPGWAGRKAEGRKADGLGL